MSALKEFANFIILNMPNLAATYARLLAQTNGYGNLPQEPQLAFARQMLNAVIAACHEQTAQPVRYLVNGENGHGPSRPNAQPLAEIECLGQTLMPVVPNLEASRFLWSILSQMRGAVSKAKANGSDAGQPESTAQQEQPFDAVSAMSWYKGNQNRALQQSPPKTAKATAAETQEQPAEPASGAARVLPTGSMLSIAKLEQVQLTIDTPLADLPVYDFQVDVQTVVHEVEKILRQHMILPGVIIADHHKAIGVISRRKFFEQLGQLYGVAVYLKRPIRLMLQAIGAEPLHLPSTVTVPEAIRLALSRPPMFVYEPIIVEFKNQTYRLLDIYTLLIAQTKLFSSLQLELQQANDELEARIEKRTSELVKVNADLTEQIARRKQVEEALILARDQALAVSRLKSELLAKVSHELRTPLGAILGHAEMIQVGVYGAISGEQEEATTKIIKSTNYLTSLVNQLLDQAQFEAGKLKLNISNFDPRQIIKDLLSKLGVIAQNKGLTLTADVAANLPNTLKGDPVRVQQILMNLVSNAIKFTERGSVQVKLFCHSDTHWAMQVCDTGPGIPAEAQHHIFEPFGQVDGSMTRQHTGTGLGLSIVKQLVSLMGGQIKVDSKLRQGSTFTIILPLQPEEEQ